MPLNVGLVKLARPVPLRIQVISVAVEQVDGHLLAPFGPIGLVQIVGQHVNSEFLANSVHQIGSFVENLDRRPFPAIVVP